MNSSLLNEIHRTFIKFLRVYCYAILKNRFVAIKKKKKKQGVSGNFYVFGLENGFVAARRNTPRVLKRYP